MKGRIEMGLMLARANAFVRSPMTLGIGLGAVAGGTVALSARRPGEAIGGDTVVRDDFDDDKILSVDPLPGTMFAGRSMLWASLFGGVGAGAGVGAAVAGTANYNGGAMSYKSAMGVGVAAAVTATLAYRAGEWIIGRELDS